MGKKRRQLVTTQLAVPMRTDGDTVERIAKRRRRCTRTHASGVRCRDAWRRCLHYRGLQPHLVRRHCGDGGVLRDCAINDRIEREGGGASQRACVGRILRLSARNPQHTVIDHEPTEPQQDTRRERQLDQDRTALAVSWATASARTAPHRWRAHGFCPFSVFSGTGASTRPPPPSSASPSPSPGLMNLLRSTGSGGTSLGSSGRTRCGVIKTRSSVRRAESVLLLNRWPTIGRLLSSGIACRSSTAWLSSRPAIANDCPSRSSTLVSARLVLRAGTLNPARLSPLAKSSVLTSGRTFSRITSPAIVGLNV